MLVVPLAGCTVTPTRGSARKLWKVLNPITRPLAGYAPWWVLLETTGRRSGQRRFTPFANGPIRDGALRLIAVHGDASGFAHNIRALPAVRVKRRGRWLDGTAELVEVTPELVEGFSRYARSGLRTFGDQPRILRVDLATPPGKPAEEGGA